MLYKTNRNRQGRCVCKPTNLQSALFVRLSMMSCHGLWLARDQLHHTKDKDLLFLRLHPLPSLPFRVHLRCVLHPSPIPRSYCTHLASLLLRLFDSQKVWAGPRKRSTTMRRQHPRLILAWNHPAVKSSPLRTAPGGIGGRTTQQIRKNILVRLQTAASASNRRVMLLGITRLCSQSFYSV